MMNQNHNNVVEDDFQQRIERLIRDHGDEADFPKEPSDFDAGRLTSYLFDHQAALDSEGTEKSHYMLLGILVAVCVFVLDLIPASSRLIGIDALDALVAIAVAVVLYFLIRLLQKMAVKHKLKKAAQADPDTAAYVMAIARKYDVTW